MYGIVGNFEPQKQSICSLSYTNEISMSLLSTRLEEDDDAPIQYWYEVSYHPVESERKTYQITHNRYPIPNMTQRKENKMAAQTYCSLLLQGIDSFIRSARDTFAALSRTAIRHQ
mgnify:FL=1